MDRRVHTTDTHIYIYIDKHVYTHASVHTRTHKHIYMNMSEKKKRSPVKQKQDATKAAWRIIPQQKSRTV